MVQVMREAAEMYALGTIGKEDVEYLVSHKLDISKSFDELPQEFHDYVKEFSERYDEYLELCENAESPEL